MIPVAIFVEDQFRRIDTSAKTMQEAHSYVMGLYDGAGYYAGNLSAYVIGSPDSERAMREDEASAHVVRAYEAVALHKSKAEESK